MSEVFSILLHNRQRYEQGKEGLWLSLPTTTEKLQTALREIGISADNPQDFFLYGYRSPQERPIKLPRDMVLSADVDELNFLAARLEKLDAAELAELNAALTNPQSDFHSIGQIIDYPDNVDFYVHLPDVTGTGQLGDYYLNRSGMVDMPEEWKAGIFLPRFGLHIANVEHGVFTNYGYLVKSGDEWQRVHEGQPVPEEYQVMSYPAPEVLREEKIAQPQREKPPTVAATAPQPVVPIILNGQNHTDRMKEITDQLETGIQELFESERYKAYLTSMSKFHNYSFNNTLLIAMQGGQLVAGYTTWKKEFNRNVKKDEKAIKILAPAPFKAKKEIPKLDGQGRPVIGKDGKPVTETKEIQVPAFKIVSVFDVSQTEGEPLPSLGVEELTGGVERYQDFFKALEQTALVPIAFENIPGGAHGYYHLTEKRIAIQEGMSELQTLKTAIHEIAHSKLHAIDPEDTPTEQANRPDSRTREVQAESVAYAVCQHYGLDTSDYSFGYVAGWSSGREVKELKASLETIRAAANELISEIDGNFAELQQQREKAEQSETYSIYQLKGGEETRDYRFEPLDRLQARGLAVNKDNYELVYSAPLHGIDTLEDIYRKFNLDHPADFTGHSLSVSDVVVLRHGDRQTAHYCDSYGFTKVPQFLQEQQPTPTPDEHLTGEKIRTPRGNFSLTSMSVEQMKAAGYSFHHSSDDGKYNIMTSNNRAFAVAVEPSEKSNPLKTVELSTEQNENMLDGRINNTPSVGELEAKLKAGETISLTDLAAAVKNERKAERGKPQKKPSIRAQLKADKEAQSKKQAAKTKTNDLEV